VETSQWESLSGNATAGKSWRECHGGNAMAGMPQWECHSGNALALVWVLEEGYPILLHERSVYACELREYECEYECEV